MDAIEFVKSIAESTRAWRERILQDLQKEGCHDLSYRPKSGMSAIGWLLAHQGAAYDYTLNMLIKNKPPMNPVLFYQYRGDSTDKGDWVGTSIQEIDKYFHTAEHDLITWIEQTSDTELHRILEGPDCPDYYQGKRVINAITDMFAHLNHHNGHLSAIKGDWCQQKRMQ